MTTGYGAIKFQDYYEILGVPRPATEDNIVSRQQREYVLRQQLRAIQQELGEENPEPAEAALLRQRLAEAKSA